MTTKRKPLRAPFPMALQFELQLLIIEFAEKHGISIEHMAEFLARTAAEEMKRALQRSKR